jgi:hypothetical protein
MPCYKFTVILENCTASGFIFNVQTEQEARWQRSHKIERLSFSTGFIADPHMRMHTSINIDMARFWWLQMKILCWSSNPLHPSVTLMRIQIAVCWVMTGPGQWLHLRDINSFFHKAEKWRCKISEMLATTLPMPSPRKPQPEWSVPYLSSKTSNAHAICLHVSHWSCVRGCKQTVLWTTNRLLSFYQTRTT